MHTMSRTLLLTFVPLIGAGCASVTGARFAHVPKVRTVTSIGDKPVSIVAGAMGESVTVGNDSPDLRVASEGQISGRVLDAQGHPASNAEVRVAVGGASAGRLVRTRTDEAGGFTLHGLRPDASYTLVAEGDDAEGPRLVGQQVARAPSRRVLISLADPDQRSSAKPSSRVRPVSEASVFEDEYEQDEPFSVNEDDLPLPDEAPFPTGRRYDPDDAPEAAMTPGRGWRRGDVRALSSTEDPTAVASDLTEPIPSKDAPGSIAEEVNPLPPALNPPDDREPIIDAPHDRPSRRAPELAPAGSEPEADLNPLPPSRAGEVGLPPPSSVPAAPPIPTIPDDSPETRALDPGFSPEPAIERDDPPPIAPATSPSVDPPTIPDLPSATNEPAIPPPTIPDPDPVPAADTPDPAPVEPPGITPNADPAPEASTTLDPAPSIPPVAEIPPIAEPPIAEPPVAELPSASEAKSTEPTAAAMSQDSEPPSAEPPAAKTPDPEPGPDAETPTDAEEPKPEAEPTVSNAKRPTWGDVDSKVLPTLARSASLTKARAKHTEPNRSGGLLKITRGQGEVVHASCKFDAKQRRLVDFQLPDLQGQPVRFKDLDADLVLIDFWGTWCGPCVQSIPHLVELQSRFGPSRLKVVGVAYEQGTTPERTAAVEAAAHRLGINYTVLLGEADGQPCPLQGALNVQAFPTMILVDRQGRILWRDQGATKSTLDRLERVIASNAENPGVVRR
ncbi:MAG: redoxin domain-containing protein [Isosphaeraceae bacterium]